MAEKKKITCNIRRLRFEMDEMTQADLAKGVGVTRQTIIAMEQSRYSPSLELAFKIAVLFNKKVDDIFEYG